MKVISTVWRCIAAVFMFPMRAFLEYGMGRAKSSLDSAREGRERGRRPPPN
jgi:hypothetical protein